MIRINRNFWLGLGLALILSATGFSVTCASPPDDKAEMESAASFSALSEAQIRELNEVIRDMFVHIREANRAIHKKSNAMAYDNIDGARGAFAKLKREVQVSGLLSAGSQSGALQSGAWFPGEGDMGDAAQKIRIPVHDGNQLVFLTRLISDARIQSADMTSLESEGSTRYGHGEISEGSDSSSAMSYGQGSANGQSMVVIDLSNLDQLMNTAMQAVERNQYDQAEDALTDIQMQAVNIEYSPSQAPLARIGEAFARVKSALEAQAFDEARLALQNVNHELMQFGQQAPSTLRPEIDKVRTDIQTWSNQMNQHADQADDKIDGWWNQMAGWFDQNKI